MIDLFMGAVEPPKNPLLIEPEPIVIEQVIKPVWQDNPNNCIEGIHWIAEEEPFYCIEIPVRATTARVAPSTTVRAVRASSDNLYASGNCTFFAKSMRPDLPNNLGNANTWVKRASAQGIPTGSTPKVGAIGQKGMHVVYVTGVNSDGTFNLSEWNYRNLYEQTDRTVSSVGWSFIY